MKTFVLIPDTGKIPSINTPFKNQIAHVYQVVE